MLNVFQIAGNDQSQVYLGQIFGNVGIVLAGTGGTLLSSMFKVLNTALLVLGTFMVAYATIAAVLKTAQEGEFMGKHWNSLWFPLRMLLGIAGLVPTSSGYCAIQVIMMWIIMQGVGMADMVWGSAINYFALGGSIYKTVPGQQFDDVAGMLPGVIKTLFSQLVCQAIVVKYNSNNASTFATTVAPTGSNPLTYVFGRPSDSDSDTVATKECGELNITPIIDSNGHSSLDAQKQAISAVISVLQPLANGFVNKIINADVCWESCDPDITDSNDSKYCVYFKKRGYFTNSGDCRRTLGSSENVDYLLSMAGSNFINDSIRLVYGYAQSYVIQNEQRKLSEMSGSSKISQLNQTFQMAQANGWIFAGAFYYYIAAKSNPQADSYNAFLQGIKLDYFHVKDPNTAPKDLAALKDFIYETTSTASYIIDKIIEQANAAVSAGGGIVIGSSTQGIPSEAEGAFGFMADAAISVTNRYMKLLTPGEGDPLVKIHEFGHSLLIAADYIFVSFFGAGIILGLLSTMGVVIGTTVNLLEGIAKFIISWLIPIAFFFMGYLISIGSILGLYLPLIPFLLFTFGAINWFIGVIEAMTAAPIIAIGILSPGGQHEIMGRAENSIMMTLSIFLRPTLMVFGMMTAMLLAYVLIQFVNGAFYMVLARMASSVGIIEAFLYLIGYGYLVVTILNKCYSLIHVLPERVLSWIGGHAVPGGEEGMAGEVKGGISAGAGAYSSTAKAATGSAFKKAIKKKKGGGAPPTGPVAGGGM